MLTESSKIVAKLLYCSSCDYTTSRKNNYDKHILTSKHKLLTNVDAMLTNVVTTKKSNICECGKIFKFRQSLHVHKKKCHNDAPTAVEECNTNKADEPTDKDLIMMVVKQNTELIKENSDLKTMMVEQSNKMMEVVKNVTIQNSNNNTINSHNKSFNLNFFLNETCKDAMNITEFVESIKLRLTDLERVGELGYIEGISNIIVKNLKDLDVTQRPVHCRTRREKQCI